MTTGISENQFYLIFCLMALVFSGDLLSFQDLINQQMSLCNAEEIW